MKPTKRTLPCFFAAAALRPRRWARRSGRDRCSRSTSWICHRSRWSVCSRRSDSSSCCIATSLLAAVGADLGHHESAVALALQRVAEPLFAHAVVIFPGVVEEIDAGVDGAWRRFRWLRSGLWWSRDGSRRRRGRTPATPVLPSGRCGTCSPVVAPLPDCESVRRCACRDARLRCQAMARQGRLRLSRNRCA